MKKFLNFFSSWGSDKYNNNNNKNNNHNLNQNHNDDNNDDNNKNNNNNHSTNTISTPIKIASPDSSISYSSSISRSFSFETFLKNTPSTSAPANSEVSSSVNLSPLILNGNSYSPSCSSQSNLQLSRNSSSFSISSRNPSSFSISSTTPPKQTLKYLYILCGTEDEVAINKCFRYNVKNNEWKCLSLSREKRGSVRDSSVLVGNYIYVFGGSTLLRTFEKLNLKTNRWESETSNFFLNGGESISALFNGKNSIYLVGGYRQDFKTSDRIDRYEIIPNGSGESVLDHKSFITMKSERYRCYTLKIGDYIYIIGGIKNTVKSGKEITELVNNIERFKDDDNCSETEIYLENLDSHEASIEGVAYDGQDLIYLITNGNFFTLNIKDKQKNYSLQYPTIKKEDIVGFSILFDSENNRIILIASNSCILTYYINSNKWVEFNKRICKSYDHSFVPQYQ